MYAYVSICICCCTSIRSETFCEFCILLFFIVSMTIVSSEQKIYTKYSGAPTHTPKCYNNPPEPQTVECKDSSPLRNALLSRRGTGASSLQGRIMFLRIYRYLFTHTILVVKYAAEGALLNNSYQPPHNATS